MLLLLSLLLILFPHALRVLRRENRETPKSGVIFGRDFTLSALAFHSFYSRVVFYYSFIYFLKEPLFSFFFVFPLCRAFVSHLYCSSLPLVLVSLSDNARARARNSFLETHLSSQRRRSLSLSRGNFSSRARDLTSRRERIPSFFLSPSPLSTSHHRLSSKKKKKTKDER